MMRVLHMCIRESTLRTIHSFLSVINSLVSFFFFFFNDTATTEIYTLSLHDALPIFASRMWHSGFLPSKYQGVHFLSDRKSTRLNSSHSQISYAVFCLKKKTK